MNKPIAPIRTRLDVVIDRWKAGLPFYWEATGHEVQALASPERTFLGQPISIIDQEDRHFVLQRPGGTVSAEDVEPYLLALRSAVSQAEYAEDRHALAALFDLLDGLGTDDPTG